MKTTDQLQPNYAPVYAAASYPELAKIFQKHGYARAVHGSLIHDLDLIAVPWIENPSSPEEIFKEIEEKYVFRIIGEPTKKPHGRVAYWFSIGFGECAIDLSFFPDINQQKGS